MLLVGNVFFNSFHIELLATSPDTQSAGYGGALLEHAIIIAKDKGVHFVTLETMSFNTPNFYLKHDFEVLKK
ncbi:GNAT family N-acetyltransferase [Leuconostoc citreum]